MSDGPTVVEQGRAGRIVTMDSITQANEDYGPDDVLIGGSWMGIVPVSFAVEHRPRAVLCNDGGVGVEGGGINGLFYLDGKEIPGAAVDALSAEIANGRSHWETGVISYVNHWALACGCEVGMSVPQGARKLLNWSSRVLAAAPSRESRDTVFQDERGQIIVVPSIKYVREEDAGKVICVGSHGGETTCRLALEVNPKAVITSDGGVGRDEAGIRGLRLLADGDIPGVAVSVHSAAIGDGKGIYEHGIVSAVNSTAQDQGMRPGMRARDVALALLG